MSSRGRPSQLQDRVARLVSQIRRDIRKNPESIPGTIDGFRKRYAGSLRVVRAALYRLRERGDLTFSQGTLIRTIADTTLNASGTHGRQKQKDPIHVRLANEIQESIADGEYRAGETLPKSSYLAAVRHMSRNTVLKAYRELERRGFAAKEGMSYVVGNKKRNGAAGQTRPVSVVLILSANEHTWYGLYTSARTEQFCRVFLSEAERTNVRIILHTGAACRDLIANLGIRYRGALLVGSREEVVNMLDSVSSLFPAKQSIVWFDRNDEGVPPALSGRILSSRYDESAAAETAVRYILNRSHRKAVYVYRTDSDPWVLKRFELLRKAAVETGNTLSIDGFGLGSIPGAEKSGILDRLTSVDHGMVQMAWRRMNREKDAILGKYGELVPVSLRRSIHAHFMALHFAYVSGTRNELEPQHARYVRILHAAWGILPVLEDPDLTMLLSPNDTYARGELLPNLRLLEIPPTRVSLLSFDNYVRDGRTPLTSVDFGMGGLGYRSFHAIIGDVPVRTTRRNEISARPLVVERGSVVDRNGEV